VGRRIGPLGAGPAAFGEIVGVVSDVQSVAEQPVVVAYQVYRPMAQEPRRAIELAVRTAGGVPGSVVADVRTTIMSLDPDLPIRRLQSADANIERANYQLGVLGSVLSALATLGLGLATLGVYGVIARTVAQRSGEFGIRLALGARARDITRLVLGSGLKLALVGSAVGLLGAFGVTRLIVAAFPGMSMNSIPVLAGATLLLIVVAQLAGYLPARAAARVDPIQTLRAD
jgi:hypothetical protein